MTTHISCPVKTDDGSYTFRNHLYDQTYHSKSGALEEGFLKFVFPTYTTDGDTLLDYCFGLGYNSLCALLYFENLTIYALENDPDILRKSLELQLDHEELAHIHAHVLQQLVDQLDAGKTSLQATYNNSMIFVFIGDARETIKDVPEVCVVYFDPFSPQVCPHLWTEEVFEACYDKLVLGGVLTTYSCARSVRDAMRNSGFVVLDGPIVGRRSPSTLAYKY